MVSLEGVLSERRVTQSYNRHIHSIEKCYDNLPKWLTGALAKSVGFARVGSNPTIVVFFVFVNSLCEHQPSWLVLMRRHIREGQ